MPDATPSPARASAPDAEPPRGRLDPQYDTHAHPPPSSDSRNIGNDGDLRRQVGRLVVDTQQTIDSHLTLFRVGLLVTVAASVAASIKISGLLNGVRSVEEIPLWQFARRKKLRVRMIRQSRQDPSVFYVYHTPFVRRTVLQDVLPHSFRIGVEKSQKKESELLAIRLFGVQVEESSEEWVWSNFVSSHRYLTIQLLQRINMEGSESVATCNVSLRRLPVVARFCEISFKEIDLSSSQRAVSIVFFLSRVGAMTTSVDLALRQYPALGSLEHSTRSISKFLGPPPSLLLSEACKLGNIPLLDWIWFASCTEAKDRSPGWSLTNYLRSDPHYYRWQFSKSLYVAAERGDKEIVQWLFAHFEGCEAPIEVAEAAARGGHLQILQFLWRRRSRNVGAEGSNTALTSQVVKRRDDFIPGNVACTVQFDECDGVNWGETAITKAIENGQLKECLAAGMPLGWSDRPIAIKHALNIDQSEFAETLLPKGRTILDYAFGCPRLEVIKKMVKSGRMQWNERYATSALINLAKSGSVELMERLFQLYSPLREDHDMWKEAWRNAFKEACSHSKLHAVEWLMVNSLSHEMCEKMKTGAGTWHHIVSATKGGHIEVMQFLYEHGLFNDANRWTTQDAICDCPLASVKWLADHIWVDFPQHFSCATAEAVRCGRVDLLDFFQSLDSPQGYEALGKRRRQTGLIFSWSANLLYWAVSRGQLDVLKWLQENRPGESDSDTMDIAASRGYLDIVEWLHANRSEGCSSDSMYRAAQNSHFEMVKWLYENRPESHTCEALVQAIRFGHLRIAYWLRKKYPDYVVTDISVGLHKRLVSGCWESSNALDTLLFLRVLYPSAFTPRFLRILQEDYSGNYYKQYTADLILGWLDNNYPSAAETTN